MSFAGNMGCRNWMPLALLLVALLSWQEAHATTALYAIYSTATRDGFIRQNAEETGCATWSPVLTKADSLIVIQTGGNLENDLFYYDRGFASFDLTDIPATATVDSAKVKLVVSFKYNGVWDPDIKVYIGDCCIGNDVCDLDLALADSTRCGELFTTIDYGDIPAVGDTLTIVIPPDSIHTEVGSFHALDMRMVEANEGDVCTIVDGANSVYFWSSGKADNTLKPRLYVWVTLAAEGKKRVWGEARSDGIDIQPVKKLRQKEIDE